MKNGQRWRYVIGVALLLGVWLLAAPHTRAASAREQRCFTETGHCLQGRFLDYWRAHGGLAVFGYPLSDEVQEKLLDHQAHQVQYFERARFELHPESAPPYDVQLGQLGRYYHAADPPVAPAADAVYFAATGHNLGGAFLDYWRQHGGLASFGYPLTEEYQQPTSLTTSVTVQYFERVRLEHHPEAAGTPYAVQPARLGAQVLIEREDRGNPGVPLRPGLFAPDEPAFTEQDVRQFLEDTWAAHPGSPCGPSGPPAHTCPTGPLPPREDIVTVEFLTSYAFKQRVPIWGGLGVADGRLLCVVTLRTTIAPSRLSYLVFDAHTGKPAGLIGT